MSLLEFSFYFKMYSSSETPAFPPGDPVLPTTQTATSINADTLLALHRKHTIFNSHHSFVSTCLRHRVAPKGLTITLKPCVPLPPIAELLTELEQKWSAIIHGAILRFLKVLRIYHLRSITLLSNQIDNYPVPTSSDTIQVIEREEKLLQERHTRKLNSLLPPHHVQQCFHQQKCWTQQQRRWCAALRATTYNCT